MCDAHTPLFNDTIQQIECPTDATKDNTNTIPKHVKFIVNHTIPETLGYMSANFTGLGSNNPKEHTDGNLSMKDEFLQKIGLGGTAADSQRIYGYNHYVPVGEDVTCSSGAQECNGKRQYFYMRNYPLANLKGNLSFAIVDDLVDLNPISMLRAMFGNATGVNKCVSVKLPVGSHLDNPKMYNANHREYLEKRKDCRVKCKDKYTNHMTSYEYDNCMKNCKHGWWEQQACIVPPAATRTVQYPKGSVDNMGTYKIPVGSGKQYKEEKPDSSPSGLDTFVGSLQPQSPPSPPPPLPPNTHDRLVPYTAFTQQELVAFFGLCVLAMLLAYAARTNVLLS